VREHFATGKMGKSQRITFEDTRAIFRLLSDLRELRHDQPVLQLHLVDQLSTMVNSTGVFIAGVDGWVENGSPVLTSMTLATYAREAVARTMQIMGQGRGLIDDPSYGYGVKHKNSPVHSFSFSALQPDIPAAARAFPLFGQACVESKYKDHLVVMHDDVQPAKRGRHSVSVLSLHRCGKGEKKFNRRHALVRGALLAVLDGSARTARAGGLTCCPSAFDRCSAGCWRGRRRSRWRARWTSVWRRCAITSSGCTTDWACRVGMS
jgi:hypothetical protein